MLERCRNTGRYERETVDGCDVLSAVPFQAGTERNRPSGQRASAPWVAFSLARPDSGLAGRDEAECLAIDSRNGHDRSPVATMGRPNVEMEVPDEMQEVVQAAVGTAARCHEPWTVTA